MKKVSTGTCSLEVRLGSTAKCVRAARLRVDGLLHDDGGDVAELAGELRLPLLAGDLELPFLENLKQQQAAANESDT